MWLMRSTAARPTPLLEQETGAGNRRQHPRPAGQDLVGDLGRVVQAAERHPARPPRGRLGIHVGSRARVVTESALRQADEPLLVIRVRKARWVSVSVGEVVVHRRQAGRAQIAQVRRLNGRGLPCESQQPVPGRMTGQVHEDVDVVLTDDRGGLRIGEPHQRTPDVSMGLESQSRGIGLRNVGVAEELHALVVVAREDRLEEVGDGMLPEVGRDVADPQATPGKRPGGPGLDRPGQRLGVLIERSALPQ